MEKSINRKKAEEYILGLDNEDFAKLVTMGNDRDGVPWCDAQVEGDEATCRGGGRTYDDCVMRWLK